MNISIIALTGLVLAMCAQAASAPTESDRLHALFNERAAWELEQFPGRAMSKGDYSRANRLTDASLAAIERRHQTTAGHLDALRTIDKNKLSEQDKVNYELFELELSRGLEGFQFRTFLAPVNGRDGPQQDIPQMAERVRFNTAEDYVNYLERLQQTPKLVTDTIVLMRHGLKEGRTPPKVAVQGVPDQFKAVLESDGLEALAKPFAHMPKSINPTQQAELKTQFETRAMPAVRQALKSLSEFVVTEYLPDCRTSIAAKDWPDGENFYNHQLRVMTTTDMTAKEIHELGQREVARIKAEMMQVIRSSDYMRINPPSEAAQLNDAALFKAFVNYLRTDPRFYHKSAADLLAGYRDICKRVDAQLPKYFNTLPRLPYGVDEIPLFMAPQQTTAYYQHGDIRNAEAGYFMANTYALDQRPKYEMISLAMHEAVPGHHLQIAIAQELDGLPEFRKDAWFTAFGEGWALYSERLGIEMGLYADPYDDFGRLLYEMWRACRLVVDPGMHALGWSRDQAVQFMIDNTALSELNINNEIDRYIAWPGQACAYKIGELKIRELRAKAESQLGDKFDLRTFHDVVLGAGAVPLTVLERRVNEWIKMSR